MKLSKLLFIILLFQTATVMAAQKDSLSILTNPKPSFIKKQILPLSLMSAGALLNIGNVKEKIQDVIPRTNTGIDDVLEYTPMAQLYIYDALGFEHKNTVWDHTKYLVISQFISKAVVLSLKYTTKVERPNGGGLSFPSGHTANAFTGATVLFYEFKDTEPLLAWSGYMVATATGILRLTNNEHWMPDVLFGAGIGILSANLVYHFEPLKNWQPFKKKDLCFVPMVSPNSLGLLCRF